MVLAHTVIASELINNFLGAGVLPNNCVIDRLTSVLIPHHRGLTLIGDAHCGNLVMVYLTVCHRHCNGFTHVIPNLSGVVFNPTCLGENLLVLKLPHRNDLASLIEKDSPGAGGALVDRHNVFTFNIQSCRMQGSSHE